MHNNLLNKWNRFETQNDRFTARSKVSLEITGEKKTQKQVSFVQANRVAPTNVKA